MKSFSPNRQPASGSKLSTLKPLSSETAALFEDILNRGLHFRVKVTGRSMAPFLVGGEILTIKKVPGALLHPGDLIFYKTRDGFPLLHRIVRKKLHDNMYVIQTKGDALIAFDDPVYEHEVLGKVCGVEKMILEGRTKYIDMESYIWRKINYLIALVNLIKSKIYSVLS